MADFSSRSLPGAPGTVSRGLFQIGLDRDERMQQVSMEMLLTLHRNGYRAPDGSPRSPRRENLLLRSLVLGQNFLADDDEHQALASRLAAGEDFSGSAGMRAVQASLAALLDAATIRGQVGTHLMLPVHESLLWYDARRRSRTWDAQFVLMRGTGITLARFLLDPPPSLASLAAQAAQALDGIRDALGVSSPYGRTVELLSSQDPNPQPMNKQEEDAWSAAAKPELAPLGERIIRHAAAIMADLEQPPEVRLLHLRRIVALDVAWHMLSRAWDASAATPGERYLLICHAPQARAQNRARVMSESSFVAARDALARGVIAELHRRMTEHKASMRPWRNEFFLQRDSEDKPTATSDYYERLTSELEDAGPDADFETFAGRAYDAPGDGYSRPIGAFRVMVESCGLLRGTGRYRYLRAVPGLLAAMVSARPEHVPQEADEFMAWLRAEWSLVVGEDGGGDSVLRGEGAVLKRNAEYFERDLVDAGLATALSDQTCMVGMSR